MLSRQFILTLSRKEGVVTLYNSFDLNVKESFAQNPTGLGLANSFDMLKVGNRNVVNKLTHVFQPITFEIAFKTYDILKSFFEVLAWGNYQATLVYKIPLNGELKTFRRTVAIENVSKAEKTKGYLASSITLAPKSFWYSDKTETISLTANQMYIVDVEQGTSELPQELMFKVLTKGTSLTVSYSPSSSGDTQQIALRNLNSTELNNLTKILYSSEDGGAYIKAANASELITKDILNSTYVDVQNTSAPFIQIVPYEWGVLRFTSDVNTNLTYTIREFYIAV